MKKLKDYEIRNKARTLMDPVDLDYGRSNENHNISNSQFFKAVEGKDITLGQWDTMYDIMSDEDDKDHVRMKRNKKPSKAPKRRSTKKCKCKK